MKRTYRFTGKYKPLLWTSFVLALSLVLAACQAAPSSSIPATGATSLPPATTAPQPTAAPTLAATSAPASSSEEPVINVATDPTLGQILVDGKGMTLYVFAKDTPDKSNCTGGCLKSWPPLLSQGSPKAGTGVDSSLLSTTDFGSGQKIVTYNHMPLYFFAKDSQPGDTFGQNVNNVWFAVSPDGKPVKTAGVPSTGGTSAPTTSPTTAAASSNSAPSSGSPAQLNVTNNPKFGQILVDGKGMTLYVFLKDTPDQSNCTAGCMKAWPPFLANGQTVAGQGVDASKLGTATLADGSKIVTYNHRPLYYWAGDQQPGDVNGQNVQNVWFVAGPDGNPIQTTPASNNSGGGTNPGTTNPSYPSSYPSGGGYGG